MDSGQVGGAARVVPDGLFRAERAESFGARAWRRPHDDRAGVSARFGIAADECRQPHAAPSRVAGATALRMVWSASTDNGVIPGDEFLRRSRRARRTEASRGATRRRAAAVPRYAPSARGADAKRGDAGT